MKCISILALIFLAPVAWATCPNNWTQFHNTNMQRSNPCETKLNRGNVGKLVQKWAYPTGSWVPATPAIAGGVIYASSNDGNVYALKAGKKLWSYQTGLPVSASPAVANSATSSSRL